METNGAFLQYLQTELARRAKRNPRFSIRAFARQLSVEPSALAQILSGKRPLTDRMCERFAEPLGLSPAKRRALLRRGGGLQSPFSQFKKLDEEAFRVIADWHCYAILELTRTDHFRGDIQWIARSLAVSPAEVRAAVERLKRLGYLEITPQGRWIDRLGSANNLGNERASAAFREHQRQILKKATQALEDVPYEERVQSSMMLVGSKERVAEAKRRILNFIEELDDFLKTGETHDEVYTISVSLFPISRTAPVLAASCSKPLELKT